MVNLLPVHYQFDQLADQLQLLVEHVLDFAELFDFLLGVHASHFLELLALF